MVSSCRNNGTISQELRYPFTGTVVQFWQESSSTTESVRLYGTPVSIGGKTPNMLTVRSGRQTVSCRGLAVPGARNTHAVRKNDTGTKKQNYKNQPTRKQITPNQTTPHSSLQKSKTSSKPHQTTPNHTTLYKNIEHTRKCVEE